MDRCLSNDHSTVTIHKFSAPISKLKPTIEICYRLPPSVISFPRNSTEEHDVIVSIYCLYTLLFYVFCMTINGQQENSWERFSYPIGLLTSRPLGFKNLEIYNEQTCIAFS